MKKKKRNNLKLSACMIVKNEEAMLERCLTSIKHIVDEIIIVDTGSMDKTVEIAASFNAKTYHHPWEHDFSKHRNQSLNYATGDWLFVIDADEELDSSGITKKELKRMLCHADKDVKAFIINVLEKNNQDQITNTIKRARFFKNDSDIQYSGIVHNTPEFKGNTKNLDLNLFHYGYALPEEQMQEKFKRTSLLLHRKLEQHPDDYSAFFYLSQLCMQMGNEDKAIEWGEKYLNLLHRQNKTDTDLHFYRSIYHLLAMAFINREKYHKALEIVRKGLERYPDEIDLLYDLACAGYFLTDQNLIIEGGEAYLSHMDRPKDQSRLDNTGFASTTNTRATFTVKYWLMTAYLKFKRFNDYEKLWNNSKKQFMEIPELHEDFLSTLEKAGTWNYVEQVMDLLPQKMNSYSKEAETAILQHRIFLDRKQENYADLENTIKKYLAIVTDYQKLPVTTITILSEYFLKKNDGKSFLETSMVLLELYIQHELDSIKNTAKLALAYHQLALQQDSSEKGILTALTSLNIAWVLTDDKQYLAAMERVKQKTASSENIAQAPLNDTYFLESQPATADSQASIAKALPVCPAVFRTALAEVNITPKVSDSAPISLQGIAGPERKATRVISLLKMQMLLIENENHTKLLFVSADLFAFGREMVELVKKAASTHGITPEAIILNASHTHYAPGTLQQVYPTMGHYFEDYAMEIAGIIRDSLGILNDNLEASLLYSGKTNIKIGVNRRFEKNEPNAWKQNEPETDDPHTPFLLIEQQKSHKRIIMVNHGCQPDGLTIGNNISADFPGFLREELINTGKVDHVMFLQGASGDVKEASPSNTHDSHRNFARTLQDVQENGRSMARNIESALDNGALLPLTDSSITCTSQEMYLRLKKTPGIERVNELKNDIHTDAVIREWASRLSATYPAGDFPNALSLDVQVVVIGNSTTFICFPAAPVKELGVTLKSITESPETTFVLGCTNGFICYLPDDKTIELGGYESEISPYYFMIPYLLARGTDAEIISNVKQCLKKIHSFIDENKQNSFPTQKHPDTKSIQIKTHVSMKNTPRHVDFIKNNKVLHGTYEIANQMYTITRALRESGFCADTVSYYPNYLGYKSDHVLDIQAFPSQQKAHLESRKYAEKLIDQYDIFHFHFSQTLTLDHSDLPTLQNLSKKRIAHYWGSEVRVMSIGRQINPYVKVKQVDESVIKRQLEYQSKYIPHAMVGDYELFEYVKDYHDFVHIVPAAIIIEDYPYVGTDSTNAIPLLVHAPTSPEIKGSKYILKAIEDLKDKYTFDFKLIQNTSHEEAKKWYAKADLIIDELHCGTYGLLTIELMSMGKPVLTWISDYMREKYPQELPVVSANPDNIKEKIEYMLNNRDIFPDLGRRGRDYVEKYHDIRHVANQIISTYKLL